MRFLEPIRWWIKRKIEPQYWTQLQIDALSWRAHKMRREMGFVECVDLTDPKNIERLRREDGEDHRVQAFGVDQGAT